MTLQTGQIFTLLHCRLNRGIQLPVDALVVINLWHFSFACPLSCPPLINVLVTEKSNVVSDAVIPITCAFWKCSTTEYGHIFLRYAFCSLIQLPNLFDRDFSCFVAFVTGWPESCGVDRCCSGRVLDQIKRKKIHKCLQIVVVDGCPFLTFTFLPVKREFFGSHCHLIAGVFSGL